jgi:hypothetical protein
MAGTQQHTSPVDPATKDPDEWTTGEEAMTAPQESYLHTLAHEAGEDVPDSLTKAEASKLIDELQRRTGRGRQPDGDAQTG